MRIKKLRPQQQLKQPRLMQQDSHQPDNSPSYQNYTNSHPQEKLPAFTMQLSSAQAAYLAKLLPHLYSFQLDPKNSKRKTSSQKNIKSQQEVSLQNKKKSAIDEAKVTVPQKLGTNRSQAQRSTSKASEEIENAVYQKYNAQKDLSRRNSFEGISESLKPCIKILTSLKNSRTSWPFREPVDPVALGIPHYTEIVKEPMDLSTIENNLRTNQYITPTQFHADVSKIITNSYTFNSSNIQFTKVTAEFESYYRKITAEPNEGIQRSYSSQVEPPLELYNSKSAADRKPKKQGTKASENSNSNAAISMSQKKELGLNIKKLPKEHMKGILDIVNQGKIKSVGEFDLKQLDAHVIRKLQFYVKEKLAGEHKHKQVYGNDKAKDNDKEESSFQIDEEDES